MASPYTDADVLTVAPMGANGVTVTPNATAWTPSSWVEVSAATSSAWVVAGVHVVPPSLSGVDAEIDVAVGAAGVETPIATFAVRTGSSGATLFGHNDHYSSILIARVASGDRVSVRIRKTGTSTSTWRIKVAYYPGPLSGMFNTTTTQSPYRIPSAAAAISVTTPASAWANSAYGVLHAATSSATVLLGACIELNANGPTFEVDIATGPAAAETVIATLWESSGNVSQGLCYFPLTTPLGPIPAGTRLTGRGRSSSSSAVSITISLLVMPHPY